MQFEERLTYALTLKFIHMRHRKTV